MPELSSTLSAIPTGMAFIRVKKRGDRRYAYLVESVWDAEKSAPRQRVVKYLGPAHEITPEAIPDRYRSEPAVARWLAKHARDADAAYRSALTEHREALKTALLAGDRVAVDDGVRRAVTAYGPWAFLDDVATPLLHEVGEEWYAGKLTVVDEHVITRGIGNVMRRIRDDRVDRAAKRDGLVILLANPEGERHALALELLEIRLAADGHRTIVSAGGAPPRDVAKRAQETGAHLVLVSATLPTNRENALATARAVLDRHARTLIALGGQAWADARAPKDLDERVRVVGDARATDALPRLVNEARAERASVRAAA